MFQGESGIGQKVIGIQINQGGNEEYAKWADIVPIDCDEMRITIPSTANFKVKSSVVWKMLKDIIGKDLS